MKIQFLGGAKTVTGSCHMMEAAGKRFCVDCGMHQGSRDIEERNQNTAVYKPAEIDFICMTHAHIDHSGLLPRMVKDGFKGVIYATAPTRDLLAIMLEDSAHIQEMEAEWKSKKRFRKGKRDVAPLYTIQDAHNTMPRFQVVEYNTPFEPAPGITVTYKEAGHILGSAFLEFDISEPGENGTPSAYRLIFSGDLGRPNALFLRDPEEATPADFLFVESTYGDRNHKDEATSRDELAEAIAYSYKHGEKVIIPAFAVERTQEVIYSLFLLREEGRLPADMPVYVDSPLAIKATEIFRKHPEYFDAETHALLRQGKDPLSLPNLRFTQTREESQAINALKKPAVVISASGMCNAGRIKHHLRHNLWKPGASIVFVGFQAKGTPGRKLVDGVKTLRMLGDEVSVQARIFTIGGFSAHAGQSQILAWLSGFARPGMKVYLVHGENSAQKILAGLIKEQFKLDVHIPGYLEECVLKPGKPPLEIAHPQLAEPRIDWPWLMQDAEAKMAELQRRMDQLQAKPWVDQTELRDRLVDITAELASLIAEM
ncbi:MBL fold metallo-hydrolase RNA specificity domain-containing protein [Megalodesulfovibrio paquesii]